MGKEKTIVCDRTQERIGHSFLCKNKQNKELVYLALREKVLKDSNDI